MIVTPSFYEKEGDIDKGYDLFSRLLKDRIVLLFNPVDTDLSCSIIAQLLYLESLDSTKDISMYINSSGGSVSAGLGIYDTLRRLKCDVSTICVGEATGVAALLLGAGAKGKRYALENGQIMLHQVSSQVSGQATDIGIEAEHTEEVKKRLNYILAKNTGHSVEDAEKATDRKKWMFAEEAKAYGLIDNILVDEK